MLRIGVVPPVPIQTYQLRVSPASPPLVHLSCYRSRTERPYTTRRRPVMQDGPEDPRKKIVLEDEWQSSIVVAMIANGMIEDYDLVLYNDDTQHMEPDSDDEGIDPN